MTQIDSYFRSAIKRSAIKRLAAKDSQKKTAYAIVWGRSRRINRMLGTD